MTPPILHGRRCDYTSVANRGKIDSEDSIETRFAGDSQMPASVTRILPLFAVLFTAVLLVAASAAALPPVAKTKSPAADATPPKSLFTGKVVMLREALKRRGVTAYSEFDKQVVLETPKGDLIPIVPDWRGRAFYQDKRLRDRKVDLVGYRRKGVPYLQVLMIFTYNDKGERQYTDYWCDICSIPMYEIKPCDCCQGENRLRFQPRPLPNYLGKQYGRSTFKK